MCDPSWCDADEEAGAFGVVDFDPLCDGFLAQAVGEDGAGAALDGGFDLGGHA